MKLGVENIAMTFYPQDKSPIEVLQPISLEIHTGDLYVILGYFLSKDNIEGCYDFFSNLTRDLPSCLLVQSTGEANLLA